MERNKRVKEADREYYTDTVYSADYPELVDHREWGYTWKVGYGGIGCHLHRLGGPALIVYEKDGTTIAQEVWVIEGDEIDLDELADYIALPEEEKVALKLLK